MCSEEPKRELLTQVNWPHTRILVCFNFLFCIYAPWGDCFGAVSWLSSALFPAAASSSDEPAAHSRLSTKQRQTTLATSWWTQWCYEQLKTYISLWSQWRQKTKLKKGWTLNFRGTQIQLYMNLSVVSYLLEVHMCIVLSVQSLLHKRPTKYSVQLLFENFVCGCKLLKMVAEIQCCHPSTSQKCK